MRLLGIIALINHSLHGVMKSSIANKGSRRLIKLEHRGNPNILYKVFNQTIAIQCGPGLLKNQGSVMPWSVILQSKSPREIARRQSLLL